MIDMMMVLLAVSTTLGLGITIVIKGWASHFHRSVAGVFIAVGVVSLGEGLGSLYEGWNNISPLLLFSAEMVLGVCLLYAVIAPIQQLSSAAQPSMVWQGPAAAIMAAGFNVWIVAAAVLKPVTTQIAHSGELGLLGHAAYVFLILLYVVSIARVEGLLRTLSAPLMYQLKFVLVGLAALAGFRIFALSEMVLAEGTRLDSVTSSLAVLACSGVVGYGFVRARFQSFVEQVHISPKMLYGSVTFLVIGLYLFAVGIFGQLVRSMGVSFGKALSVVFVFLALVGLAVILSSRSAQAALQTFIARNLYRSKYDYRAQWLEVTEVFLGCDSMDAIWDRLLRLLTRTFYAGRISVWHKIDADSRFHQVRSANTEPPPEPLEVTHDLIRRLVGEDLPVAVEAVGLPAHDHFLEATHAVLCVPIRSASDLIGFVALSGDVAGLPYGQDDRDLLKAIAHHVGVLLAHARLAEERQGTAELEALHRFAAFCMHDLKNLTARLSLVAQNAQQHGQDSRFQESAIRTVGDTVEKMMILIGKLSSNAPQSLPVTKGEMVDLSAILGDLVVLVGRDGHVRARLVGDPLPPVRGVREQLYQVLLNIVLNAKQALGPEGEIVITQAQRQEGVVITVADTGCGISSARQRLLFSPSQSTRPGGLGIGLYQCKQMVEAHHGTIRIRSTEGIGTQVQIELPLLEAAVEAGILP